MSAQAEGGIDTGVLEGEQAIARQLGAEDAALVASAGLAVVVGLRACGGGSNAVVLQRGHVIDVGGSPLEWVRMAGLAALEIGLVDRCRTDELEATLPAVGAGLFVSLPASQAPGLIDLPHFLWACHRADRPVLAHYRGGPPWDWLLDTGADLISIDLGCGIGRAGGLVVGRSAMMGRLRAERSRSPALYAPPSTLAGVVLTANSA